MSANQAKTRNYIRPELSNDKAFEIIDGRHPVVENKMNIIQLLINKKTNNMYNNLYDEIINKLL